MLVWAEECRLDCAMESGLWGLRSRQNNWPDELSSSLSHPCIAGTDSALDSDWMWGLPEERLWNKMRRECLRKYVAGPLASRDPGGREDRNQEVVIFCAYFFIRHPQPELFYSAAIPPQSLPRSSWKSFCSWPCLGLWVKVVGRKEWLTWDSVTICYDKIWTVGYQNLQKRSVPTPEKCYPLGMMEVPINRSFSGHKTRGKVKKRK